MIYNYENIIGCEFIKSKISQIFTIMNEGDWLHPKTDRPTGILLHGPPGTGKTTIAKLAITKYCSSNMYIVHDLIASDLFVKLGKSSQKVEKMFADIKADPIHIHVVMLDETDEMFVDRKHNRANAGEMTSAWLRNFGGYGKPLNMFVFGTTNYIGNIDSAILSRFSYIQFVGLPNHEERKLIIEQSILSKFHVCDVNTETSDRLATMTKGLSGREIEFAAVEIEMIETDIHRIVDKSRLSTMIVARELTMQFDRLQHRTNATKMQCPEPKD